MVTLDPARNRCLQEVPGMGLPFWISGDETQSYFSGDVLNSELVVNSLQERLHIVFVSCSLSEGCRNLEYLNLSWCDQITKDGIEALVRGCRGLKALLLRGCTQVPEGWYSCLCYVSGVGTSSRELLLHFSWCPTVPSPGFQLSNFVFSVHSVRRWSSETHSELLPWACEPQLAVLFSK